MSTNFHTYPNQSGKLLEGECSDVTTALTSESEREEAQGITLGQQLRSLCTAANLLGN